MAAIFRNAHLKVKRANSHIDSLVQDSTPLSKDLYEITYGPAMSAAIFAEPDCFDLAYRPKEPITEHFGAIMGDTVNNLREALEYWINAAIKGINGNRKVYFPFSAEWKDLETSPNYPAIQQAFPDLAAFIRDQIKPCRDTNLDLWAAASLCNFNKHNDFVPVITVVNIQNINARIGTNIIQNLTVGGDANHKIGIIRSDGPFFVDKNLSASIEITFPKGAVFEDQPVIPTLTNMAQVVAQTLQALEKFVAPYIK